MYNAGLSVGEVASAFGVSRQSMWDCLKRRGVVFRPQKRMGDANTFYRGGKSFGRRRASIAVRSALEKGILRNPGICEACKSTKQIEGHHDDYNKPLQVRWLCHDCHFSWHRSNKPVPALSDTYDRQKMVTINGDTKTATAWARHFGLNPVTVLGRLRRGYTIRAALGLS